MLWTSQEERVATPYIMLKSFWNINTISHYLMNVVGAKLVLYSLGNHWAKPSKAIIFKDLFIVCVCVPARASMGFTSIEARRQHEIPGNGITKGSGLHVGAGNQAWLLCQSSKYFLTTEPSLRPQWPFIERKVLESNFVRLSLVPILLVAVQP